MVTILDLRSSLELNDDQFAKICRYNPDRLSGEEILPGFVLDLNGIL